LTAAVFLTVLAMFLLEVDL